MSAERDAVHVSGEVLEAALARLAEALAVLDAVDEGGHFDQLPHNPDARTMHQRGVCMLAVARRDLRALANELEAAWSSAALLSGSLNSKARRTPRET